MTHPNSPTASPTAPLTGLPAAIFILFSVPVPNPSEELELDPDEKFELEVAEWVREKGNDRRTMIAFINRLADQRMRHSSVLRLMEAVDGLSSPEARTLAVELVANGAFTRRELREPERIKAFFARPDWTEIVTAWRESRLPTIGQVIQGIEAAQRRKAKETIAPPPAKATKDGRRDTRDDLVTQLKALLPRSLRDWATDFAEGLRAMAADTCAAWDANTIAAAIKRRRMGTGTKICHRTVASGLPHLVQLGYVTIEGDKARIRPGAFV